MNWQALLNKYNIEADINNLMECWQEPHRDYHSISHMDDLVQQIEEHYSSGNVSSQQKEKLLLTALFHDIIYEPCRIDNEERSAEYFLSLCRYPDDEDIKAIAEAILATTTHEYTTWLSALFNELDMNIVTRNFKELLQWENGIYNEYKDLGIQQYKTGRLYFLKKLLPKYPQNKENLEKLIDWVEINY